MSKIYNPTVEVYSESDYGGLPDNPDVLRNIIKTIDEQITLACKKRLTSYDANEDFFKLKRARQIAEMKLISMNEQVIETTFHKKVLFIRALTEKFREIIYEKIIAECKGLAIDEKDICIELAKMIRTRNYAKRDELRNAKKYDALFAHIADEIEEFGKHFFEQKNIKIEQNISLTIAKYIIKELEGS